MPLPWSRRRRLDRKAVGLIEHVTWMNSRYGGQTGWVLSSRMSTALRQLADKIDHWRKDGRPARREKDERLVAVLQILGCTEPRISLMTLSCVS